MAYVIGHIRTDRGRFADKGNQVWDITHPDFAGGAVGDGVEDCTEAIRACYAAVPEGGTMLIPEGRFRFTEALAWDRKINVAGVGLRSCLFPDLTDETDDAITVNSGATFLYRVTLRDFSILSNLASCANALILNRLSSAFIDLVVGCAATEWGVIMNGVIESRVKLITTVNYTHPYANGMPLLGALKMTRDATIPSSCNSNDVYVDIAGGTAGVRLEGGSVSEGNNHIWGTIQGTSGQGFYAEICVGLNVMGLHTEGNGVKAQFVNCTVPKIGPGFMAAGSGAAGKISIENCRGAVLDGVHCDSVEIDDDCVATEVRAVQYGINSGTITDNSDTTVYSGALKNAGGGQTQTGSGDYDANLFSNGAFEYWPGGDSATPAGASFYSGAVSFAKCGDGLSDTTRHTNRFCTKVTSSDATGFAIATFTPDGGIDSIAGRWVTLQAWVYAPTDEPQPYTRLIIDGGDPIVEGPTTTVKDEWVRLSMSYLIPSDATSAVFGCGPNADGHIYIADVTIKIGRTAPRTYVAPIQGQNVYINGIRRTAAAAMPTTGGWRAGDYVENTAPAVAGSAGSQYVIHGWKRITTGTDHTLNTDWVEDRGLTGE